MKNEGTVILASPCQERISPIHKIMRDYGDTSYSELIEILENNEVDDLVGFGGALSHSQLKENINVLCYSEGLTKSDKEALGFEDISSIEEGVEEALIRQGKDATIGVIKSSEVLPVISNF